MLTRNLAFADLRLYHPLVPCAARRYQNDRNKDRDVLRDDLPRWLSQVSVQPLLHLYMTTISPSL